MASATSTPSTILYYVHDPMCSWCWGFRPTWLAVQERLDASIQVQYILGGLAPDSDEPMPDEMRGHVRGNWEKIQKAIPGTAFNYDFWTACKPRRSTYPSCRAIIATRNQRPDLEAAMLLAIQHAYYLNARNPSDNAVLIDLARELGLDTDQFGRDLDLPDTHEKLLAEIDLCDDLHVHSYPSLVLRHENKTHRIQHDYNEPDITIRQIENLLGKI